MSSPQQRPVRVGNEERQSAAHALGDHFSHGRLDAEEYEERVAAAYAARTHDELERLFDDLPRPPAPVPVAAPLAAWPGASVEAPHGRDPVTGRPYSDRSKVIAGVLQLVLPIGIGRFYTGHTGLAVAQLLLSFVGIGVLWAFIDGIVLLAGRPADPYGRPLRS